MTPDSTTASTGSRAEGRVADTVTLEPSPHAEATGIPPAGKAEPCVAVIFGATGDLAKRELLPSLFELHCRRLLPDRFAVVGTARSDGSDQKFREVAREGVREECAWDAAAWDDFANRIFYVPADVTADPGADYARLAQQVARVRDAFSIPDNVFFHLAVPPRFFGTIVRRLGASALARTERGWRRLVIEKPFGADLQSARALDRELRQIFEEDQIYRIDHFLGKETVQNMLAFRFANPSFEPIWNRNFIDHVQITVAESIGIGGRADFYEETGVIRDMVQNHLLQLLCMSAMEPPGHLDAVSLRDETVKVLRAVRVEPVDPRCGLVLGQYARGEVAGERVSGYREEEGVRERSSTPTYGALKLTLDNWRWAGVPFYLRTGKRLARKLTEVAIHFLPTPHLMFPGHDQTRRGNVLCFRLQPEESIVEEFYAKRPGPEMTLEPVRMLFRYAEAFGVEEPPRAYAWLLGDVMSGDQTLFARADWIEQAWRIVDPFVARAEASPPESFPNYPAGSAGPAAADELLRRDDRAWRPL